MNLFTNLFRLNGQQGWQLLGWTMCYFLAAGTVVALAGALVRFFCKRFAPQIRYTVSLAVFATLAALPFGIAIWLSPSMSIPVAPIPIVIDLANTPITMSPVDEPIKFTNIAIAEASTPEAVPLVVALARRNDSVMVERAIEFLPWLWLIGTPLTFLLLATGLIGSNRLRRQCTQLTEGSIIKTYERLRTSLAVSQRVGIAINERIATPLLIGIVRPLILLPPAALTGWSPDELEMVLLHELAHVRRWDNLVNFGQRLVESLLFFHPAVWWVSRWVRRDREECCDAVVVDRTAKPQAYAELLVTLATPSPSLSSPPLAGLAMAQHPLAGRIRRILHLEEEKMLVTRSTLGLVGLFFAAILGIALWQPATPTVAQETKSPVAPRGSARESKSNTTEDTEKTSSVEAIFDAPDPIFADPGQGEIWLETQTALIKSDFILHQAMEPFADDGTQYPAPTVKWLQDRLRVRFIRAAVVLSLDAKNGDRVPASVLSNYLQAIGKSYEVEWKKSAKFANVNQSSPFPTLEAQRSADLVYKLLNVELEQLDKEELARVKAMKFAGGLKVTRGVINNGPVKTGDLLVGLHVWPTTSLAEVKKVLERDDLEDLSPLKFYVLRKVPNPENPNPYSGPSPDVLDGLVTGRIVVNIDAMKKKAPMQRVLQSSPWPSQTALPVLGQASVRTARRILDPRIVPPGSARDSAEPRRQQLPPERSILLNAPIKLSRVYDGKTFGTWKTLWRRDLSSDLRAKAVRAFVAFANAEKGKEAVDEIMAIVAECDWTEIGRNAVTAPLKEACVAVFAERQLPIDIAVETVIDAKDSKNAHVRAFLPYVILPLSSVNKEANELMREAFPEMKLPTFEEYSAGFGGHPLRFAPPRPFRVE